MQVWAMHTFYRLVALRKRKIKVEWLRYESKTNSGTRGFATQTSSLADYHRYRLRPRSIVVRVAVVYHVVMVIPHSIERDGNILLSEIQ